MLAVSLSIICLFQAKAAADLYQSCMDTILASITQQPTQSDSPVSIQNTVGSVIINHFVFSTGQQDSIYIYGSNYSFHCNYNNEILISNGNSSGVNIEFTNDMTGCLNVLVYNCLFKNAEFSVTVYSNWQSNVYLDSNVFNASYDVGAVIQLNAYGELNINNCTFSRNRNTALTLYLRTNSFVTIENTIFSDNIIPTLTQNSPATALSIQYMEGCSKTGLKNVTLHNVTFIGNGQEKLGIGDLEKPVVLICLQELIFIDCYFINNRGSALMAVGSTFKVFKNLVFANNTATEGGALNMYGGSTMVLSENSTIEFINNYALNVGGAIVITQNNQYPPFSDPVCFITVESYNGDTRLYFYNNTADNGGDAIYGGSLDGSSNCIEQIMDNSYFRFQENNSSSNLSLISSDPSRVCLCDNEPQCLKFSTLLSVYPGETVNLNAFTVGQHFGTSRGTVYAQVFDTSVSITKLQRLQKVSQYRCESNLLSYTLRSTKENAYNTLVLTANDVAVNDYYDTEAINRLVENYYKSGNIPTELLQIPVFVNVHFKPCPVGFQLVGDSCQCINQLQKLSPKYSIKCIIKSKPMIRRDGTLWVDMSLTSHFRYSEYCINTHCNITEVFVEQNASSSQCIDDHAGVLCGNCQKGYSLAIGSSRCLKCNKNTHVSFVILFAAFGVILVSVIKYLNLTVNIGALNGLIFFANIIQTSNVFLPQNENGIGMKLFPVVIAWLNLDFGIETCFIKGMDMYTKTWLQFVFPLYIWSLVVAIIVICRYSQRATRFFGNNAVQVLCTLFLLSYSKLLRNTIVVFSMASVTSVNVSMGHQTIDTVWLYDGTFQHKHIPLLIVSGGVLIFLCLPFTTFLLFGPWLQCYNHYRGLKWVGKMTPLLDAFYSPFKDKCRYWVGVFLLSRVAVIIPAVSPSASGNATLLTVALLSTSLLFLTSSAGGVYKKTYLSMLENSFLLNLVAFSVLCLYADSAKQIAGYISFVHVLLTLITVVIVQLWRKVTGKECNKPACCINFGENAVITNHRAEYANIDGTDSLTTSREIINDSY